MSTLTVKLTRFQSQPWGFRLAGGKDFNAPLSVQRVQAQSLAEQAGLQPGDYILKINDSGTDSLRHKEAQDAIVRAGNSFELTVQRGGTKTWKPAIIPTNQMDGGPPVKHSLAADKTEVRPVGSSHNVAAKPFGDAQVNGSDRVAALVHNPYNSPAGLYSMQNIADTLSVQAEILTSGVKGFNFMKEDPPINTESEVYKMVKAEDLVPPSEKETQPISSFTGLDSVKLPPVIRPVEAPKTLPSAPSADGAPKSGEQNLCSECGRLIVGVFVRIKDKSLHADCFRCNTCGSSLKNVGYYNINDKLYCDVHARQVARHNPPAGNLTPVTLPPGAPLPSSVGILPTSTFMQQPPKPATPTPGTYAPIPFHGTKPAHPKTVPTRQAPGTTESTFVSRKAGSKFVWPPPKQPDEEVVESAPVPAPSAPAPSYRAPVGTQHVQYTPNVFKQNLPSGSTPPLVSGPSPIPKAPSPTVPAPFSPATAAPVYKPVAPPAPAPAPAPMAPSTPAWTPPSNLGAPAPGSAPPAPKGSPNVPGSRSAPKRGRGVLKPQVAPGTRIPICAACASPIRGPFVTALGKTWCPDHFVCTNSTCRRGLQDVGFVEEQGQLYCETCYETYLAPICSKCNSRIKGDCLNAIGKQWHPDCFICAYCHQAFGNSHFYLEDGLPYCEKDWNELFTTKCVACGFPIEAGDRWVEALNSNFHSQCFKCTICHKNLEGQSFFAKGGRPFCKSHAR